VILALVAGVATVGMRRRLTYFLDPVRSASMGARAVIAVLVLAAPTIAACGSSKSAVAPGDGGGTGPEGSAAALRDSGAGPGDSGAGVTDDADVQPGSDGSVANACDDLFNAWVACSLVLPAAAAHDAPRYRQLCENQVALPGSTTTVAEIEACAQAYKADCSTTCHLPNAGTLPAGAPCNIGWDLQCQSGSCAEVRLPDGGYSGCGVCAATIPVGQPCGPSASSGLSVCAQGSYCAGTCTSLGALGAHCTSPSLCQPGLTCSSAQQCATPVMLGGACQADIDCAEAFPCVAGTCFPRGDAGAHCTESGWDTPCDYGLECDTSTSTCVAPTVQPGDACGANGQLCIYGSCAKEGVCPTIVPDGQPCPTSDTATCDDEATCDTTGHCSIPGINACP
jgi:hypothetical protein